MGVYMIKNQWYAILASKQVRKNRVTGVKRCNLDLALFRNTRGELHCVEDLCAHRGASLSKGTVENNCIKCPFHGIEYRGDGSCEFVPSDGISAKKSYERFNLKHYYVAEKNDIIYLWYGDGKPDKEIDTFDDMVGLSYDEYHELWHVHYSRIIENQLDVSHLPFVHYNTIGRGNKTLVNGPKVVWLDENTLQTSADNEVDTGQTKDKPEDAEIKSTNLRFKFPNQWLNTIIPDKLYVLAYFVPVDEASSLICLRFYNKFTDVAFLNRIIAFFGSFANKIIQGQDKRVVETQRPKKTGLKIGENLVQADRPIIEYRRRRAELQAEAEGNKEKNIS